MKNAYTRFRARGDGQPLRPRVSRPRLHISPATKRMIVTALVIVAILVVLYVTASFWINWLWFGSMGYRSVLVKRYLAQVIIFFVFGGCSAAIFVLNVSLALRQTREGAPREGFIGRLSQRVVTALAVGGGAVIFLIGGVHAASRWETFLLFWYGGSFGVKDPTFHRDAGFYVFTLPVLHGVYFGLLAIVILTFIAVALVYALRLGVRFRHWGDVPWTAVRHLSGLGSALLLIFAFGYVLRTWMLVYSTRGFVFGPGFTDTNVVQPLNWLMVALSVLAAIGLLSGFILKNPRWLAALVGGWIVLAFILTPLLPALVERVVVQPNEFKREETYINRNIAMTRAGFGLDGAQLVDLTGTQPIDATQLSTNEPPLRNARVWDYRVAAPIYQQLQSFVPYYQFGDVDVDRYTINGQPTQVLVSARELNLDGLPANARTWTNTHLAYTHGYGLVVSPVSDVSNNGWPTFMVSDIPVKTVPELKVTQPQLYFTETPSDWVIVHTKQPEFGGIGDTSQGTPVDSYAGAGKGSIGLGNPFSRALAAISLKDQKIFLSGQITGQSRLIQTRSVVDRAKRIAPFLTYDPDPYLVVANGKLYWIIDAYTTSAAFPQATRYDGINYLRNGVKVVVDAYDGTTTFYRTDEPDPIADAYGRIYKHLFTPVEQAPPAIAAHFRYPELQFNLQSAVYSDYHVDNARTYYDGDDRWTVAEEEIGGKVQPMEPYFVTQTLPGKQESTFSLTVPFTPGGGQSRQNMTAWFAGSADATGKANLTLYRYPRSTTVFGPRQVEARIDQQPDISAQITLWSQSGSNVIRGNLLVIPVGDAMLYVQPLYLQAAGSSAAAPQLARVILVTNDRIVMRSTLPDAIRALQNPNSSAAGTVEGAPTAQQQPPQQQQQTAPPNANQPATQGAQPSAAADLARMSQAQLAHEALTVYDQGQAALQRGDWTAYGQAQQRLQQILTLMAGTPAATPAPAATPNG